MKKKPTKAEREERERQRQQVLANAERTRKLAEKALAELEAQRASES